MHLAANPILLALLSSLCIALGLVIAQYGLRHTPPHVGALISLPASTMLLWLFSPWLVDWHAFVPRAAAIFAGVGLFFPVTVTLLIFEANRRMGPNTAGALGNVTPLFALLLAALIFGEIPRLAQAFGIAAIIAGVVILSLGRSGQKTVWPWWAAFLPLAAAAIRGFTQPVTKLGLIDWPNPFAAALIGYSVSSLTVLAANSARAGGALHERLRALRPASFLWFIMVGCCNVSAVLLLYAALTRGTVTLVSPLAATYPLITLALSLVLLRNEPVSARLAGAVVLTVVGVVILIAA